MGNAFCGIVPAEMLNNSELFKCEGEKNLIEIKHYNNFTIEKKSGLPTFRYYPECPEIFKENKTKKFKKKLVQSLPEYHMKYRSCNDSAMKRNLCALQG